MPANHETVDKEKFYVVEYISHRISKWMSKRTEFH